MIIDIQPKVLPADEITKIAMDLHGYKRMLCFLTKTGEEFTVKWNEDPDSEWSIDKFCSRMKVSEMKKAWENGFDAQIKKYEKALRQKKHPYWTINVEHERLDEKYGRQFVPRIVKRTIKAPLTGRYNKFFESEIERIKSMLQGELEFVAYVN